MTMGDLEQSLSIIVNKLAHDLKNPLSVVLSNLRFLEMTCHGSDEKEAVKESILSAERLHRMIENIAELPRIKQRSQLKKSHFLLSEMTSEIESKILPFEQFRKLDISLPAIQFKTDPQVLQQILVNLLEHCIKSTPKHGSVKLGSEVKEDLLLYVEDQGPLFDPQSIPSFLSETLPVMSGSSGVFRSDRGFSLFFAGQAARALGAKTTIDTLEEKPGLRFKILFPRN